MRRLYLAWEDPEKRRWYPVGCLSTDGQVYRFAYTKGAEAAPGFVPFGRMTDLSEIYQSNELFPLFANRLMARSRPEYRDYLKWLNLQEKDDTSFVILSITEGARVPIRWKYFHAQSQTAPECTKSAFLTTVSGIFPTLPSVALMIFVPVSRYSLCTICRTQVTNMPSP